MALATGTIFQVQATATTGNTGGSGFNPANANFPTDLVGTSANTASPVVSSATYTFVAGDVNNWVYIKSGTNWISGWYQIVSVATGAATLSAAIGAAITNINVLGNVTYNATAGCATVASPTAGTYGVDYSQTDAANSTITNAASVGTSTTLTSASNPWTPVSVGNFFHLTTTGTGGFGLVGWYEIVSYVSAGNVTTDRTTNSGTALVNGTGQTGGAGRLNGLEDTFQAMLPTGALVWIKNGTYTFSAAISSANTNGSATSPIFWIGYNSIRGDACIGTNRPIIDLNTVGATFRQFQYHKNLIITGTSGTVMVITTGFVFNCKITNSSATAGRVALAPGNAAISYLVNSEAVSQNGIAVSTNSQGIYIIGSYIHDSVTGYSNVGATSTNNIIGNIFEANTTAAITIPTGYTANTIANNTIYGIESKVGIGINLTKANSNANQIMNNILYGLTTGIAVSTGTSGSNISQYNDFFNNTSDVTFWTKDPTDLALNPTFAGASQLTNIGTVSTSGTTLTDTGAAFGVTDNVDYLHVTASTGGTVGCYLITGHTATTLTVNNALGTGSAVTYFVTHGHNFQIGTNLKGIGFPSLTNATGTQTISYPDVGGVQRQEGTGGSGGSFTFVS